jgi:hypothetical protein
VRLRDADGTARLLAVVDAAERLQMVNRGANRGKQQAEAVGKDLPAKLTAIAPSFLVDRVLRSFVIPTFNLTVSNVRGPGVPLYMAGAKLLAFMPINMLLDGMGLSITGFSYNGILWVCVVADRSALPDPAVFAQCFKDSFAELLAAAARPSKPEGARPVRKRAKSPGGSRLATSSGSTRKAASGNGHARRARA